MGCIPKGGTVDGRMLRAGEVYRDVLAHISLRSDIETGFGRFKDSASEILTRGYRAPVNAVDLSAGHGNIDDAGSSIEGQPFAAEPVQYVFHKHRKRGMDWKIRGLKIERQHHPFRVLPVFRRHDERRAPGCGDHRQI